MRKSPPASFEAYFYRGGSDAHIIETELGRIGVGICYENAFYDRLRALHEGAVDLVLQPTSAPSPMVSLPLRRKDVEAFDRWIGGMPGLYARALGVPVLMANKCGSFSTPLPAFFPDQKSVFPGLSAIVDGDGVVKGQLGANEGIIVTEITLASERKAASRPRGFGRWAATRPWHAFMSLDWIQKMGARAYANSSEPLGKPLSGQILSTPSRESADGAMVSTASGLSTGLSRLAQSFPMPWSAYVRLLSVKSPQARSFYETEALRGGWSVRQLDRQIGSQF